LRLHPADGAKDGDHSIQHAQRSLDLDGEVHVAALVMVMPRSCSCSIQSIVAEPSCTSPTR
jgi:hypothetical protein